MCVSLYVCSFTSLSTSQGQAEQAKKALESQTKKVTKQTHSNKQLLQFSINFSCVALLQVHDAKRRVDQDKKVPLSMHRIYSHACLYTYRHICYFYFCFSSSFVGTRGKKKGRAKGAGEAFESARQPSAHPQLLAQKRPLQSRC